MIFGNVSQLKDYEFLGKHILKCFEYAKTHDLNALPEGITKIEGDDFFVNMCVYDTTTPENRPWEAHRKYLDVHFMVTGKEQIDLGFIENMKLGEFDESKDFQAMEGERTGFVIIDEGDFLVCYPGDAHKTAIYPEKPEHIKKAIFKVRI